MDRLQDMLSSTGDLLLVVLGFSLIIIIHEAGHFLAARWAGIRVLAFAVGFGPALFSYRKGLGFRRGSSESEYHQLVKDAQGEGGDKREAARTALSGKVSPTEYRLNVLPFGGYVKMLGQDDADPGATSDDPDSYQNCPPVKRMVVISAGVIFNIITAAVLFIVVFNPYVGLPTKPARIGAVTEPDKPAAVAIATNAAQLHVTEPGLRPGDTILSVNGDRPSHFDDFALAVAMSRKGSPIQLDVQRPGVDGVLQFSMKPEEDAGSHMLSIGAAPMTGDQLVTSPSKRRREEVKQTLKELGFPELEPGMRLVAVNGVEAHSPYTIDQTVERSGGKPVTVTFEAEAKPGEAARRATVTLKPEPKLDFTRVPLEADSPPVLMHHLLGVTPVLAVDKVLEKSAAEEAGVKDGDVFSRIGSVEWPSVPVGMKEIRANRGKEVALSVYRRGTNGEWGEVKLQPARVDSQGRIGFVPTDSAAATNVIAAWPAAMVNDATPPSGAALPGLVPGAHVVAVNGHPTANLKEVRDQLKQDAPSGAVTLDVQLPGASGTTQIPWHLGGDDLAALSRLGWTSPIDASFFEPVTFVWKSDTILGAIPMGLHETHRVMMNTYLTFARLFQGSVKVEHLKGPVGIAHVGVLIADRGFVWLLFFMALISVNLAVINFLPMPIADGGHMVFLIYEQLTGRPPSVRFQNAAAIAGLVIIGTLFLIVTFHDVGSVYTDLKRFFGG